MSAGSLEVRDLSLSLGGAPVLDGLSLEVPRGGFVSILGPSGAGKSTLFRVLNGALEPSGGAVRVDGKAPEPGARPFAWMPQGDALMPWKRIMGNVTLGLEVQGLSPRKARDRAAPLFRPFGLEGTERLYPSQLSGGMRQRAALLRTVVQDRAALLLDEPFGALDALTRMRMQGWLEARWLEARWTVLLVTHDVREAVALSDRIHLLSPRPARVIESYDVPFARPRFPGPLPAEARALEHEILQRLIGSEE